MIRLLDASRVQGRLDALALAKLGIRGAYLKCTQGNEPGVDPTFAANRDALRAEGIKVGAYHFLYPLPDDPAAHPGRSPAAQADAFFRAAGLLDLPPALDVEWPAPENFPRWPGLTNVNACEHAIATLTEIDHLFGRTPVVYTYPYWWKFADGQAHSEFENYPLWLADYSRFAAAVPPDGAAPLAVPAPWSDWTLWQHTGGGMRLPNGDPVDFDVFNGDEAAWCIFSSGA